MKYSPSEFTKIKGKAISLMVRRLDAAYEIDAGDDLLRLYNLEVIDCNPIYYQYNSKTKILVIGALAGKKKDFFMCLKKLNFHKDNFVFISYSEVKTFNVERLRFTSKYSDIICGPTPHSVEGKGDYSSLLSMLEDSPDKFPKVIRAVSNGKLKLSINSFKQCLLQTRLKEVLSI